MVFDFGNGMIRKYIFLKIIKNDFVINGRGKNIYSYEHDFLLEKVNIT